MDNRHAFRAKWHEYNDGIYFVTICTHEYRHIFGKITNAAMYTSELGEIVNDCIIDIPNHFQDTEVWNYVIMPNHVHIVISVGARYIAPTSAKEVIYQNLGCLKPPRHGDAADYFHHNSQLARIVGNFKAAVTRCYHRRMRARCIAPLPVVWQRLFHEHIIRNKDAYKNIMNYIDNNVSKWEEDCFNVSVDLF